MRELRNFTKHAQNYIPSYNAPSTAQCGYVAGEGDGATNTDMEKIANSETINPNVKSPTWLANDICRRINVSPTFPKICTADAGTVSAHYFTEMLLEDVSNLSGGFPSFLQDVKTRIVSKLSDVV